jgi:hypothetical protein
MKSLFRAAGFATFGLLSVAILAGPVSCAAIVGADDYQVGAAQGTAGGEITVGGGSLVGPGGSRGTGGDETGGGHLGTGGMHEPDASLIDAVVKKEASIDPGTEDAARRSDATVVDTGKPMPTGSGEKICSSAADCGPGLNCIHTTWGPSGLCLYGCPVSNDECDANHSCIHAKDPAVGLDYSCLKNCPTGVCSVGMVCVPLSTVSICEPMDWFPKNLGLGDDCFFDGQCKSGQCYNKPNGYCSRTCTQLDGDCNGDYTDGANYYGEFNWCAFTGGANRCIPGCDQFSVDCQNYPGTTCKNVTDVYSFMVNVCTK